MQDYLNKFDALTLRERAVLGLLIVLIPLYVWYVFLYEPLLNEEKNLTARTEMLNNSNREMLASITEMQGRIQQDPNQTNRKKIKELKGQLDKTQTDIRSSTSNLITPEQMPELLRQMLTQTQGLSVSALKGLGKSPLLPASTDDKETDTAENGFINAYKHGMKLSFRANYEDTVAFIEKLENLSSGFFWSSYKLSVEEYPLSYSEITLYTLSLDENWIEI